MKAHYIVQDIQIANQAVFQNPLPIRLYKTIINPHTGIKFKLNVFTCPMHGAHLKVFYKKATQRINKFYFCLQEFLLNRKFSKLLQIAAQDDLL